MQIIASFFLSLEIINIKFKNNEFKIHYKFKKIMNSSKRSHKSKVSNTEYIWKNP